jgi:hypothetical protein
VPLSDAEEVSSANARMEDWCAAKTPLYFHLEHAFCSFSFRGVIVKSCESLWLVQPQERHGAFGVSIENVICDLQARSLSVLDISTRTQLLISETKIEHADLLEGSPPLNAFIH